MQVSAALGAYARRQVFDRPDIRKSEARPGAELHSKKDSVELSTQGMSRLDAIRNKIASGFYTSDKVSDDISDKLGRVISEFDF